MTRRLRNGLALGSLIVALVALFIAGNVRLFTVAFDSEGGCIVVEGAALPARPAC